MDSIYDKYENDAQNVLYNKNKMAEFFVLMRTMQQLEYEDRVAYMKELWGEQKNLPATYYYGDLCYVEIFKENDKYKFTFNCNNGDFKELQKNYPELAEEFKNKGDEQLKKIHPELFNEDNSLPDLLNTSNENINLNLYRNINIQKTNKPNNDD